MSSLISLVKHCLLGSLHDFCLVHCTQLPSSRLDHCMCSAPQYSPHAGGMPQKRLMPDAHTALVLVRSQSTPSIHSFPSGVIPATMRTQPHFGKATMKTAKWSMRRCLCTHGWEEELSRESFKVRLGLEISSKHCSDTVIFRRWLLPGDHNRVGKCVGERQWK